VTIDIQSPFSGKILEFHAAEGSEVQVGQPLLVIEEGAGAEAPQKAASPAPSSSQSPSSPAPAPAAKSAEKPAPAPPSPAAAPAPAKAVGDRSENRVKMTRMRQRIAERCAFPSSLPEIFS
jgi:pyruvate/2-oxoglutarate dehydrogenase complex dihydrolipoamide acyltransferase (E2) component